MRRDRSPSLLICGTHPTLFPESQCLIASIHGYAPALPWWLYANTQAVAHLRVMRAFGRHLDRIERRPAPPHP